MMGKNRNKRRRQQQVQRAQQTGGNQQHTTSDTEEMDWATVQSPEDIDDTAIKFCFNLDIGQCTRSK